jgi:hypothetical protein
MVHRNCCKGQLAHGEYLVMIGVYYPIVSGSIKIKNASTISFMGIYPMEVITCHEHKFLFTRICISTFLMVKFIGQLSVR